MNPDPDMVSSPQNFQHNATDAGDPSAWPPTAGDLGEVVVYRDLESSRAAHDHATCTALARRLAALKGFRFAGEHGDPPSSGEARYFVPTDTLIGVERARVLGITSEQDLFGGVVPHPFVATKCISHSLVDGNARAPDGWSDEFGRKVSRVVLRGYSAFSIGDAMRAALALLPHGPVRVKQALGIGGHGQTVIENSHALEQALADADLDEVHGYGIALEQNLTGVTTHSVGQARVDDLVASYCGTQRLTENNHGASVYGGSDLLVARGDFDALLAFVKDAATRRAIEHARVYDAAAFECYRGLFASRRNYDIAEGTDANGNRQIGVLEQSWRAGGASGAEVESLLAFRAEPSLMTVHASTTERYGVNMAPPPGATIYFQGTDDRAGPLTKYTVVKRHVDTR